MLRDLCLAVLGAADREGITILQMTQELPELPEVRAVHAALARTAYERTYGALHATASTGQAP
jgi:hypothetical protein